MLRLPFLLSARAPGIYVDVKLLAVLGQCAQGKGSRSIPLERGGGRKLRQCGPGRFSYSLSPRDETAVAQCAQGKPIGAHP